MNNRFRVAWGSGGHLKTDWINFLGLFMYYLHGIDVHCHMFYNEQWHYCYSIQSDGSRLQHYGVCPSVSTIDGPMSHEDLNDRCIICQEKR